MKELLTKQKQGKSKNGKRNWKRAKIMGEIINHVVRSYSTN